MKSCVLLLACTTTLLAQTARSSHPAAAHHAARTGTTAHATTGSAACVEIPTLSPKIPALPAGSPCPHALYTLTTVPPVKLDYASPMEGTALAQTLGFDSSTFSLAYVDTKIGTGPLAEPHKWYTIHYTGWLTDGTKFDSSVDRNSPIVIHIGEHNVIPGWDTGFAGMHVGGKRRLFIPYQLAYGANGRPPSIPAKSELVFDVELIAQDDVEPKPAPEPKPASQTEPNAAPQSGSGATEPSSSPKP